MNTNKYLYIKHPNKNIKYNILSNKGKKLIKKYIQYKYGSSDVMKSLSQIFPTKTFEKNPDISGNNFTKFADNLRTEWIPGVAPVPFTKEGDTWGGLSNKLSIHLPLSTQYKHLVKVPRFININNSWLRKFTPDIASNQILNVLGLSGATAGVAGILVGIFMASSQGVIPSVVLSLVGTAGTVSGTSVLVNNAVNSDNKEEIEKILKKYNLLDATIFPQNFVLDESIFLIILLESLKYINRSRAINLFLKRNL